MAIIIFFYLTWVSHRLSHDRAKWALYWALGCWWTTLQPQQASFVPLSPSALFNITVPYWGRNGPEMTSQASVGMLGGQWSQPPTATPPQGFLMSSPWNSYTLYTKCGWRGSSCIYWIGISFPFSHIFNTFLLRFVILSLHCTDPVKHLVQCRAFLKDDKQEHGCVCTFLSSGCFPAHTVVPCFSPL